MLDVISDAGSFGACERPLSKAKRNACGSSWRLRSTSKAAMSRSSQHALTCGQLVRPHQPNNEQGAPKSANTGIRVGLNSKSIPQKTAHSKKMAGLMTAPWQARGDSARFSLRLKRGSPPSPNAPWLAKSGPEAPPGEHRKGCLVPRERPRYRPRNQGLPRPWGQGVLDFPELGRNRVIWPRAVVPVKDQAWFF